MSSCLTTVTATTDDVSTLRAHIDAIDKQLAHLIQERCRVSTQIQSLRVATGGPRVAHAREAEVIKAWRQRLGAPGVALAEVLLELARGRSRPI